MLGLARQATGRDEAFCLDVVQEAFLRVIRRLPVMDEEASLSAWLRRATLSAAYDRLRAERRRVARERTSQVTRCADSERDTRDAERLNWLRERIAEMEPDSARLLHLRFGLGWTLARIGSAVGLKPGAVDGRIGRTVKAMREEAGESNDV